MMGLQRADIEVDSPVFIVRQIMEWLDEKSHNQPYLIVQHS